MTCIVTVSHRRMALVRLTERGGELLRQAGVPVVMCEWERCEQAHGRGREVEDVMQHTAAICAFLHHARQRGYTTEACPTARRSAPAIQPDAAVMRHGLRIYVEVQRRGGAGYRRAQKWRNQGQLQGFAAICAMTPGWAARLARQAQYAGVSRGVVTALSTLVSQAPVALWTHRWLSLYGPLEEMVEDVPEVDWLI